MNLSVAKESMLDESVMSATQMGLVGSALLFVYSVGKFTSASHSLGEGLTFVGTAVLVASFGWRWGFWGPGLVCLLASLVLYRTLADRPQTYGLPSINEYKGEPPEPPAQERASVGRLQLEVIRHLGIWILALASACLYVGRYGLGNRRPPDLLPALQLDRSGAASAVAFLHASLRGSAAAGQR